MTILTNSFIGLVWILNGKGLGHVWWRHDTKHNDTQQNGLSYDTEQNTIECHYAVSRLL